MSDILKGNYKLGKNVEIADEKKNLKKSIEEQFESRALKNLGGSIAFVRKKRVIWELPPEDEQ